MKANCMTRALWHWSKYGGQIIYDNNHAIVVGGLREFFDDTVKVDGIDILEFGLDFLKRLHAEFLNEEELLILGTYFSTFGKF